MQQRGHNPGLPGQHKLLHTHSSGTQHVQHVHTEAQPQPLRPRPPHTTPTHPHLCLLQAATLVTEELVLGIQGLRGAAVQERYIRQYMSGTVAFEQQYMSPQCGGEVQRLIIASAASQGSKGSCCTCKRLYTSPQPLFLL